MFKWCMWSLIFILPIHSHAENIEFLKNEYNCAKSVDIHKVRLIADQLNIWDMPETNQKIIAAYIVQDMVLNCLEDKYK